VVSEVERHHFAVRFSCANPQSNLHNELHRIDQQRDPKFTRNRKQYPNAESALKLMYLAIHEASKRWTMHIRELKVALNCFPSSAQNRVA
jgi:transposase-like protein